MKDVPDDQKKDSFEGLSKAAIYMGEGPILYLQIMKTLGIMCICLTILNIPLFLLYSSPANRLDVNFFNVNSMFTHFHLGNIGRNEYICQTSNLDHDASVERYEFLTPIDIDRKETMIQPPLEMKFKCAAENEYIYKIIDWGFLFKLNLELESFSHAATSCSEISKTFDNSDQEI